MADELTITTSMTFSKSGITAAFKQLGKSFDVAGDQYVHHTQSIATSEVVLDKADLDSIGFLAIRNLDATNYVTLTGESAGAALVRLNPGEVALFNVGVTDVYAIANTAACMVEYLMVEE